MFYIFAVRRQLGISLFEPTLCLTRWLLATCRNTQRLFLQQYAESTPASLSVSAAANVPAHGALDAEQKMRMANKELLHL